MKIHTVSIEFNTNFLPILKNELSNLRFCVRRFMFRNRTSILDIDLDAHIDENGFVIVSSNSDEQMGRLLNEIQSFEDDLFDAIKYLQYPNGVPYYMASLKELTESHTFVQEYFNFSHTLLEQLMSITDNYKSTCDTIPELVEYNTTQDEFHDFEMETQSETYHGMLEDRIIGRYTKIVQL